MDTTPNLDLPYIAAAQAQKHVTHNEALRALDAIIQLGVLDRNLMAPPVTPSDGDRYIVAAGASGEWAGHDTEIAARQDGRWIFYTPQKGWLAHIGDENRLVVWDGAAWSGFDSVNPVPRVGVNGTADDTNRLSVKSDAVLFSHDDVTPGSGDQQLKLNKASAANTASLLLQDGYSGRAELGLTGDNDLHVKVSPDGVSWFDGILVDKTTGAVSFPNSVIGGGREMLMSDRTYYVRTDGNDGNTGLADTAGGAFATIQRAIDIAAGLDISTHNVTIRVADGTYATDQTLKTYLGAGSITIEGNTAAPSNVFINAPGSAFAGNFLGRYIIKGFKISASGYGFYLGGGNLDYQDINFGACSIHVYSSGAHITATSGYEVSGGAGRHVMSSGPGSLIRLSGITITLTGAPAFSTAFAHAEEQGQVRPTGLTFVGGATGKRFTTERLGLIQTNGMSTSWLPGNAAGTESQGGLYT